MILKRPPRYQSRSRVSGTIIMWCLASCFFGWFCGINYEMFSEASGKLAFPDELAQSSVFSDRGGDFDSPSDDKDRRRWPIRKDERSLRLTSVRHEATPIATVAYHVRKGHNAYERYYTVLDPWTNSKPRRPVVQPVPRPVSSKTAALCSILKGGERYLNEWLDYNVAIGFSKMYLYDNNEESALENWLNENRPSVNGVPTWSKYIEVVHWPGKAQQMPAIRDCTQRVIRNNHTWAAYFDDDEYMVVKKHANVVEYLTENLPSGSININWQLYGPEDPSVGSYSNISMEDIQNMTHDEVLEHTAHISPVLGLPSPLIHRNQHMQIFPNHVNGLEAISSKIILHLDSFESWPRNIPHIVKVKEGLKNWNSDGMEMDLNVSSPWRVYSSGELAALHHYRFRSVPEFIFKSCSRGRPDAGMESDHQEKYCQDAKSMMSSRMIKHFRQVWDDSAWAILKERVPWYRQFEA